MPMLAAPADVTYDGTDTDEAEGARDGEVTAELSPMARLFLRKMANPDAMAAPLPGVSRRMIDASKAAPDASQQPQSNGVQSGQVSPGLTQTNAAQNLKAMMTRGIGSAGQNQPPSAVSTIYPAKPAPQMPADYAATEADLRSKSTPTPRTNDQGNTLPQYQITPRQRFGRAMIDALKAGTSGGLQGSLARAIGGVVGGAFGDKNAPGYYGKGAVNSNWNADEQARQNAVAAAQSKIASYQDQYKQDQTAWKDSEQARNDDIRAAADQDVNAARQETNSVRADAQALKEQMAGAPTYDPQTGKFMRGNTPVTPKNNDEGYSWEISAGLTKFDPQSGKMTQAGPYTRAAMQERKNNTVTVRAGGQGPRLTAVQKLKLDSYMKANKIDDISDMSPDQINAALATHTTDPNDQNLTANELANLRQNPQWMESEGELNRLREARADNVQETGSSVPSVKKLAEENLAGIDARIKYLTNSMNDMRNQVRSQRKGGQTSTPAANAPAAAQPGANAPATKRAVDKTQKSLPSVTIKGQTFTYGQKLTAGPHAGKYISFIGPNGVELSDRPPRKVQKQTF